MTENLGRDARPGALEDGPQAKRKEGTTRRQRTGGRQSPRPSRPRPHARPGPAPTPAQAPPPSHPGSAPTPPAPMPTQAPPLGRPGPTRFCPGSAPGAVQVPPPCLPRPRPMPSRPRPHASPGPPTPPAPQGKSQEEPRDVGLAPTPSGGGPSVCLSGALAVVPRAPGSPAPSTTRLAVHTGAEPRASRLDPESLTKFSSHPISTFPCHLHD